MGPRAANQPYRADQASPGRGPVFGPVPHSPGPAPIVQNEPRGVAPVERPIRPFICGQADLRSPEPRAAISLRPAEPRVSQLPFAPSFLASRLLPPLSLLLSPPPLPPRASPSPPASLARSFLVVGAGSDDLLLLLLSSPLTLMLGIHVLLGDSLWFHGTVLSNLIFLLSIPTRMDEQSRQRLVRRGAALVVVLAAWIFVRFRLRSRRRISYAPLAARDQIRQQNLMFIYNSDDTRCIDLLRMKRAPFFQLCDLFRSRELLKDSVHSSVEEQVAMFLHVPFLPRGSICVGELRNEMILSPSSATPTKILQSSRWNPFFKDCVGAIDGTHVLARVPASEKAAFLGRKHTTTQNVLAAVDFDLRFTYVLAGWEGSAHDACVLADALERDDGLRVPQGKYFPVDAGYAAKPGFLPPYRATRHSALRVTVERAFGDLKNRLKILYNKPFHPFPTQVKLVLACCILHNWILRHGIHEHVPSEAEWVGNQEQDTGSDENNPDNLAWVAMRDMIADQMWVDRAVGDNDIVEEVGQESVNGDPVPRFHWDAARSGFMLRRFADIVIEGNRTDKGFKEAQTNEVAKHLTEFAGVLVSGTQVYNHLRKWRIKWGKICRLKNLSAAFWDDNNFMITLNQEHYNGHIKPIDLDAETPIHVEEDPIPLEAKPKVEAARKGKRKRMADDEVSLMCGLTEAIKGFSAAVGDAIPGLRPAVMNCPGFTRGGSSRSPHREKKASGLMFVEMTPEDRDLWLKIISL
ncbi:hypothetical protein U9M48_042551 [Paspalum notatum var. saurae]|uniref:Transposase n=1 Tax=Paspalum notatum var. saurae TaxID=547442 RepID=A0AAQ3UST8_PASNO